MSNLYFYIMKDNEEIISTKLDHKGIPSEHVFVDSFGDITQWKILFNTIKKGDMLYFSSIKEIAANSFCLKHKMMDCHKTEIITKDLEERIILPEMIMNTIDFILENDRRDAYKKQMAGIQKALDEKRKGLRNYGRPGLDLPKDFEANLKKIIDKEMTHEEYRKKIGFKKSTYFAKVKEVKKSWDQ